ncbi:Hypothetical protein DEACI_3330 [Acididesulfobacillus acetoxydans]|uniref:Uncharacterized protein n=1 Tax=Acididesulfobacillus acetoxydans TaxID=1561005 RepID=A0A8S0X0L5_9FIRM|nr:hypothetical protein [Acididesulfobacillus acetoxydans]CAA7602651.1 Hypothetical protein DEACI_3330 [Acididesulfobacillus acetoxydans]CEJ09124.1 Hypothetical protein DEACI_3607 [Acididesulfobacillus acetoxydans]
MKTARLLAAILMGVSAATHLVQLIVMNFQADVLVAGLGFGLMYAVISLGLFINSKVFYYIGAILPTIGGMLGVYRYLFVRPNWFSLLNVGIDLVVVPSCIYLIVKLRTLNIERRN